jgi:hypothetical protein
MLMGCFVAFLAERYDLATAEQQIRLIHQSFTGRMRRDRP